LLALADVDDHVVVARVEADDLPAVDLVAGAEEHLPALLEVEERERDGLTRLEVDEHALQTLAALVLRGAVVAEDVVERAGAARVGQELRAVADEAAGGDR